MPSVATDFTESEQSTNGKVTNRTAKGKILAKLAITAGLRLDLGATRWAEARNFEPSLIGFAIFLSR